LEILQERKKKKKRNLFSLFSNSSAALHQGVVFVTLLLSMADEARNIKLVVVGDGAVGAIKCCMDYKSVIPEVGVMFVSFSSTPQRGRSLL
jgi:hypothetical protein